jgi:hypothetical protein
MDLYCQMCAEPYEDYHVRHDMPEDERKDFLDGKGCHVCRGQEPEGGRPELAIASSVLMDILGDDLDGVAAMMEDFGLGY